MKHRKLHATKFSLISKEQRVKGGGDGGNSLSTVDICKRVATKCCAPSTHNHFSETTLRRNFMLESQLKTFGQVAQLRKVLALLAPFSLSLLSFSLSLSTSLLSLLAGLFAAALQLILSHAFDQIQLKVKRTTRVRGNYSDSYSHSLSHSHSHSHSHSFSYSNWQSGVFELCYQHTSSPLVLVLPSLAMILVPFSSLSHAQQV